MTFLSRGARKARSTRARAKEVLRLAERLWSYRRDRLEPGRAAELAASIGELRGLLGGQAPVTQVEEAVRRALAAVESAGGAPGHLAENVEFLLVLLIVLLGVRTYFVEQFVIPTNSMWPTYNGMTPEVFRSGGDEPGPLREAARILARGAWPHRLDAPADGEILVPLGGQGSLGLVQSVPVPGRSWLILPGRQRLCTLLAGDFPASLRLPEDFDFDWAVYDAFFSDGRPYEPERLARALRLRLAAGDFVDKVVDGRTLRCVRTGRHVARGERLLAFDEMSGDRVLVDRLTYHFARPRVGSGFVFRTGRIPAVARRFGDTFFIKRLVAGPGDTVQVRGTALYRNGAPIEGSEVFGLNARREGLYPGYEATGLLAGGSSVEVGPASFFAMGDNSPNSGDSRSWGFVPASEVVGRPLALYYPLARVGAAR